MTELEILPRSSWGWESWAQPQIGVPSFQRHALMVHWDGDHPVRDLGPATIQRIDREHRARGWAGIGYNFVIDRAGRCWEGRGWELRGAHCPGWNTRAIGVQLAIGAGQQPAGTMLATLEALYAEAVRVLGRQLEWTWHGAHYTTACPGPDLIHWVQTGRPLPRRDMIHLSRDDLRAIADELFSSEEGESGARYKVKDGVDADGKPVLVGLTDGTTRGLALLRQIDEKLTRLLAATPQVGDGEV